MPTGPSDRRVTPRFRVQFRTVFSGTVGSVLEGMGTVLELSLEGCRVEAPIAVQQSLLMELRIYVPDLEWPLMVDGAVVQWSRGQEFAVENRSIEPHTQARLYHYVKRLAREDATIIG